MLDQKFKTKFAKRCRGLRANAGLSQMDVVKQYEISLSHYQKIERGVLDVKLSTLVKLAEVYGVTLSELFEGL